MGCKPKDGGTSTGNPQVSLNVAGSSQPSTVAALKKEVPHFLMHLYQLFTPEALALPPPPGMVDSSGQTVNLSQFWTTLKEVEFKSVEIPGAEEVSGSEIQFPGPYTINLLSSSPSELDRKTISSAEIRRIKLKLTRTINLLATAPVELNDQSVFISGTVGGISFSFTTQQEIQYEVAGPNPVIAKDQSFLLLEIKTANLFKKINLSAITSSTTINESNRVPLTNPCPNIDSSAADLYTCLYKGLSTEANFGIDDDHSFDLGDTEDSVR